MAVFWYILQCLPGGIEGNMLGSYVLSLNFTNTSVTMFPSFRISSSYSLVRSDSCFLYCQEDYKLEWGDRTKISRTPGFHDVIRDTQRNRGNQKTRWLPFSRFLLR